MDTRELIYEEVDSIRKEYLDELEIVRHFSQSRKPGILSKTITIDAPEDLAARHDLQAGFETLMYEA